MRALLLPNGNLLVPADAADPDDGPVLRELSPDDVEYGRWLAVAEEGEDLRPGG
jgi:hypothetical protein